MKTFISDISNSEFPISEKIHAKAIRNSIFLEIQKEFPTFNRTQSISLSELNQYREKAISHYLQQEIGELSNLEQTVLSSLKNKNLLSEQLDNEEKTPSTFGQRVADKVAAFGGSWTFIITFGVLITIWISMNVFWFANKGFDPYPFILLNLILSCLAALQAPVIMMSQNRQEEKDRERSKNDYMINLKSEIEIQALHEKIDHFVLNQQQELLEFQKTQIEMLHEMMNQLEEKG